MKTRRVPEPICVRVNDAARMIGAGRTRLYELIAAGEVETVKLGKSTRITTASLRELVRQRPSAHIHKRSMRHQQSR